MNTQSLAATARQEIFGFQPRDAGAQVGYNMAVNYFGPIVDQAEKVRMGIAEADYGLETLLRNAFLFSSDPTINKLPPVCTEELKRCSRNFHARYKPLLQKLKSAPLC
ncbi:MAG: hypothetical protein WC989_00620 [Micavibrio sp.]